ncbi:uncharacterized protein [Tenebrio molitor]|uniref:uncharacterized protein n=1 Tax=Tenebrio molitor TaxID=7067 RepID=UPI003624AB1D
MTQSYTIDVERVLACPDNEQLDFPLRNLKLVKVNRTHKALSYEITYTYPLDEKVSGGLSVDRWANGDWISITFMPMQENICEYFLKYFKETWVQVMSRMGVKEPDRCPVPKGHYAIRNQVVDFSEISIPFWRGRFRFTMFAQRKDSTTRTMCMIYIASFVEKV